MIQGVKVVAASEMARIEKLAIQQGASEERFMEEAGRQVASAAMAYIEKHHLPKRVVLLIGKGNNGGDAYAAGIQLLDEGFKVRALTICPFEACSPLNRKFGDRFRKKRGHIELIEGKIHFEEELILDGFLGTGFKGKVEEKMGAAIGQANESERPILAIDIPSGLNGTTGEVGTRAIKAQETIALGLPKMGFFLRQGWNHVGRLQVADFGLSEAVVKEAEAIAYLPGRIDLPKIVRNRHKYQAGYVVGFGGSKDLPGAIKLSGLAALRAGAGIVRLFCPEEVGPVPLELICNRWNEKAWRAALLKAQAVFIGPGLGRSAAREKWLKTHLKRIEQPCVLDADALLPTLSFPKHTILTPHRGEALRLIGLKEMPEEEILFAKVMLFCKRKDLVVVLKGAPTIVFAPHAKPLIIPHGDPGMATAGSGDVLTGIITALLAQGKPPLEAAVLGVALHGLAGEAAAREKTSYCLIASDLIDFLPAAFSSF